MRRRPLESEPLLAFSLGEIPDRQPTRGELLRHEIRRRARNLLITLKIRHR
ncbi:hypothetical protein ACF08M_13145 [Streptomyces sp. NPDC015032]|uniref:hypothetical protein n=1 Tax=Streptomyces sp. NPDC015032 TaxID=3364937 RepID=UPI0036FC11C0